MLTAIPTAGGSSAVPIFPSFAQCVFLKIPPLNMDCFWMRRRDDPDKGEIKLWCTETVEMFPRALGVGLCCWLSECWLFGEAVPVRWLAQIWSQKDLASFWFRRKWRAVDILGCLKMFRFALESEVLMLALYCCFTVSRWQTKWWKIKILRVFEH